MVLSTDLLIKIKNLFIEKKYTELEFNIESLGSLDKLPSKILMFYAVSKALNPNSKKNDFKISAFHFEKIYSENKSNREAFYNLIFPVMTLLILHRRMNFNRMIILYIDMFEG